MDTAHPDRPPVQDQRLSVEFWEFASVDSFPPPRYPHRPSSTKTDSPGKNTHGLSRTNTVEVRIARDIADQHVIYTDYPGPARQRHGLTRH
ncbi:hypothetical protein DPMN_093177 [Dreissena polymorpha]|uniref:Uncharacterized protein n=1 Tax=Dreissena polymorpha TaxID=45954 RepID=A0A9D4L3L7_DREPO|nr:hypothetical protein DPMN_093177 [Dreissena polymorpha]